MKTTTKIPPALRNLVRRWDKTSAPVRPTFDPLRSLVLGVLREDAPESYAQTAIERLDAEFVDMNELRVATELELVEIVGVDEDRTLRKATRLRELLNAVFDKEGRLTLDRLTNLPADERRPNVRNVHDIGPFVEAHLMLLTFEVPALPVDEAILAGLVRHDAVPADATAQVAQTAVEAALPDADAAWAVFCGLREEADQRSTEPARSRPRNPGKSRRPARKSA